LGTVMALRTDCQYLTAHTGWDFKTCSEFQQNTYDRSLLKQY